MEETSVENCSDMMDSSPAPPPPLEDRAIPPLPPPLPGASNVGSDCGSEDSVIPTLTVSISKNVKRRNVTFLQSESSPEPDVKRQKLNTSDNESAASDIKITLQRSEKGAMRRTHVTLDGESEDTQLKNDTLKDKLEEMPDDMVILEDDDDDDDADSWGSGIDVDAMLEEDYNQRVKEEKESMEPSLDNPQGIVAIRHKIVLKEKGHEPIEGLPDDWVQIAHDSGMHLYLHRSTRVCVWSRPYLLGSGSARRHKVPVTSIPCLHYKRELKREMGELQKNDADALEQNQDREEAQESKLETGNLTNSTNEELPDANGCPFRNSNTKEKTCHPEGNSNPLGDSNSDGNSHIVRDTSISTQVDVTRDDGLPGNPDLQDEKSIDEHKEKSTDKNQEESGATKSELSNGVTTQNAPDKIHVCKDESVDSVELHNYLVNLFEFETLTVKKFKTYADKRRHNKQLKESLDRPQLPGKSSLITCQIPGSEKSGKGKKDFVINSKDKTPVCILHEYAQRVMKVQPKYIYNECENMSTPFEAIAEIDGTQYGKGAAISKKQAKNEAARATLEILIPNLCLGEKKASDTDDLEYFNNILIEDTRVYELCTKAGQLTPWMMLQEYKQRHHGLDDMDLDFTVQVSKHQRSTYTLTFGQHVVTGQCKNKKVGKQHGAQKILKLLHPHLKYWGSLIKIYKKGASIRNKEKKEAEQSIIELQAKTKNKPNEKILNKLKVEMLKMYGDKFNMKEVESKEKLPETRKNVEKGKCTSHEHEENDSDD
ncbi:microprocessor complex subunit DGCR8-like [Antedon mediterranea]|uniref:microprocessor complex subunit DGCR8-like n=1 Tax=Antedon mediterranea TaxID=105859 RepID=UPI003AF840C0